MSMDKLDDGSSVGSFRSLDNSFGLYYHHISSSGNMIAGVNTIVQVDLL